MLKITNLLYDIRPPFFRSRLHLHTDYELIVFLEVEELPGEQLCEQHIERGHTLLFSPHTQHMGHVSATSCQVLVIHFSLDPTITIPVTEQWPVSIELADEAEKLSLILLDANPGDLAYASTHLIMLVLHAFSLFTPEERSIKPVAQKLDLPEIIQQLVINNPMRPLTLEDIASHFGISVRHLSRKFHSETRDTISSHIIRCRLDIARALLRESDDKISNICARAGIPNPIYFCRCFRQYFGSTPSEYRKLARQSTEPVNENEETPDARL